MKKSILAIFAAVLILSGCNKTKQFKVNLNLENADNQKVYLCKDVDGKDLCIDSTVFVGNTAVLTANFDDPQTCYIVKFNLADDCGVFPFFTENQNTTITGDSDAMQFWTVKGCPTMDEYNAYREEILPMEDEIMALVPEMETAYKENDTVKGNELFWKMMASYDEYNNYRLDYIKNHPDSYLTHFMLYNSKGDFELAKVKEVVENFTTESVYSKRLKEYIEKMENFDDSLLME